MFILLDIDPCDSDFPTKRCPAVYGVGTREFELVWWYNSETEECEEFLYLEECPHDGNVWESQAICEVECQPPIINDGLHTFSRDFIDDADPVFSSAEIREYGPKPLNSSTEEILSMNYL